MILGDSLGYHTCFSPNGKPSVIDYFLSSERGLCDITTFCVNDPTIHSIHCSLTINIKMKSYNQIYDKDCSLDKNMMKLVWKTDDIKYMEAISRSETRKQLDEVIDQLNYKDNTSIDNDVSKLHV